MGRKSKIDTIDLAQVERVAGLGFTEPEIAHILGISPRTLSNYKENEGFLQALKKGKDKADERVVDSLYQRAIGYNHKDIYFSNYQGKVKATPYIKHYAPDVTAQIFWLKNRRRDQWREKSDVSLEIENAEQIAREFAKMVSASEQGLTTSDNNGIQK